MQKGIFEDLKDEGRIVAVIAVCFLIGLKIILFKEGILVLMRLTLSIMWMFVIPGYLLLLFSRERLSLPVRLVIGTCTAIAAFGLLSYYLGILGIHVQSHPFIIPPAIIALGMGLFFITMKNDAEKKEIA